MRNPSVLKLMANDGIEAALASLLWFTLAHRLILTGLALGMCLFPLLIHLSLHPLLSAFHFFVSSGLSFSVRDSWLSSARNTYSVNCKRRHDTSSLLSISLSVVSPFLLFSSLLFISISPPLTFCKRGKTYRKSFRLLG